MSTIKLFNPEGESSGEMNFAEELLVLDRGEQAVKDVVVAFQNAFRAGTASTKSKGAVAGSNKKPWRQKGTGRARAGYRQSPVWRGGGVAMGPRPRDFSQKINRKVQQLAFKRAMSEKIANGETLVIEALSLSEPKTALMVALLKKLGVERSALVVLDDFDENVMLAARNLPHVDVVIAEEVDVYALLYYRTLIATKVGFEALKERMQSTSKVTEVTE